jgi:hypothetical protein
MRIYKTYAPPPPFVNPLERIDYKAIQEEPETIPSYEPIESIIPIVVCVNYDDFLAITLKTNRHLFSKYIVITDPNDIPTQELCAKYDVDCRIYKYFYNNAKFNKSGAINWVQHDIHQAHPDKWILILDSDIVLPPDFPSFINTDNLRTDTMYGMVRKNFTNLDSFTRKDGNILREGIGMGYFQLYHNKKMFYPSFSESAAACDCVFKNLFKKCNYLTKTRYVSHLGYTFTNHNGRVSIRWD